MSALVTQTLKAPILDPDVSDDDGDDVNGRSQDNKWSSDENSLDNFHPSGYFNRNSTFGQIELIPKMSFEIMKLVHRPTHRPRAIIASLQKCKTQLSVISDFCFGSKLL